MAGNLSTNWGAAIRGVGVQFREFFDQVKDSYTPSWDPVVKTITDSTRQANFSGKSGPGLLSRFSEGASIPKLNRYKLYDTAFAHDQYGGQIEVTRIQLINRDFNDSFGEFKDLSSSAKVLKSKAPAQIFNGAFATTAVVNSIRQTIYNDGKPLCSTVHPRVDGGTAQSNASSTGIVLSETNIETGRVALYQQLQDDGTPVMLTGPLYLIVPIALEKTARIITESNLRSNTTDNDTNIYSGGSVNVLSSLWLDSTNGGSATAWFLVCPNNAKLVLIMRTDMELNQSVDKNTRSTLFDVVLDMSVGSYDWRGVWGSKGDAAAYSS